MYLMVNWESFNLVKLAILFQNMHCTHAKPAVFFLTEKLLMVSIQVTYEAKISTDYHLLFDLKLLYPRFVEA